MNQLFFFKTKVFHKYTKSHLKWAWALKYTNSVNVPQKLTWPVSYINELDPEQTSSSDKW